MVTIRISEGKHQSEIGYIMAFRVRLHSLAWLIPEAPFFRLTARQNISCEAATTVQGIIRLVLGPMPPLRTVDCRLQNRPAATDPMAVAAVDKLVGPASETTLGGILPC